MKAVRTDDPDFLSTFINDVVAVGEVGEASDDRETNFSLSVIEDILSNQSNGAVAKANARSTIHRGTCRNYESGASLYPHRRPSISGHDWPPVEQPGPNICGAIRSPQPSSHGVTVGHVSVNDGGQAIVGSVTQNQQEPMTQTAPATPLLSDAIGIPMPKIEESKERVPIPVSHTEDSGP